MMPLLANLDCRHLITPEGAEIVADHVPIRHAAPVLLGAAQDHGLNAPTPSPAARSFFERGSVAKRWTSPEFVIAGQLFGDALPDTRDFRHRVQIRYIRCAGPR
jgi:hypothetical protein